MAYGDGARQHKMTYPPSNTTYRQSTTCHHPNINMYRRRGDLSSQISMRTIVHRPRRVSLHCIACVVLYRRVGAGGFHGHKYLGLAASDTRAAGEQGLRS